jgi:glycosyltransferase involved in cell wall biosynthesis
MSDRRVSADPSLRTLPPDAQPLVSVVTPFYNTEDFLEECIESVLNQSYSNWEYVLVNNCSTDRSTLIAAHYAQKDRRIRLLHNSTFLSQVQNYNHALRKISPRSAYCKIVQADDWILPDCLMKMVALATAYPTVGLVSSYYVGGKGVDHIGLPFDIHYLSGSDICKQFFKNHVSLFGSATCVMIRSDLVRNRTSFYDESAWMFEDIEACFELMLESDFGFVHQILSYTRRDNESIWSRIRAFHPGRVSRVIQVRKFGPKFLSPAEYHRCLTRTELEYYWFLGACLWSRWRDKEFWKFHNSGLSYAGTFLEWRRVLQYAVPAGLIGGARAARRVVQQTVLYAAGVIRAASLTARNWFRAPRPRHSRT